MSTVFEASYTELKKAEAEIERLRAEIADLREALAFVKAERDHWHGLVPVGSRVRFPFKPTIQGK